jgi:hypothetical protein
MPARDCIRPGLALFEQSNRGVTPTHVHKTSQGHSLLPTSQWFSKEIKWYHLWDHRKSGKRKPKAMGPACGKGIVGLPNCA